MDWIAAGKDDSFKSYIHPSGTDEASYERIGREQASWIACQLKDLGINSALEYGCGDGRLLRHMRSLGIETSGVDIVPEFIQSAKKYVSDVFLINDSNVPSRTWDAIYSVTVFIHLRDHEAWDAIQYIAESVKPGGYVLLDMPLYEVPTEWSSWIGVRTYTAHTLFKMCERCGLEPMRINNFAGEFSYGSPQHWTTSIQLLRK